MQRQHLVAPMESAALYKDSAQVVLLEDLASSPQSSVSSLRHPKELVSQANQFLGEDKYAEALLYHDRALESFNPHPHASIIAWCSEATAWRNKGAIHNKLSDHRSPIAAWRKWEDLSRNCRERILAVPDVSSPRVFPPEKQICLDACIVEVPQCRANTHLQLKDQFRDAIDCHEEVIHLLLAEESVRLDYAINCYGKALLTRNHFWGDQHIDVAKSLVNVGCVLELQGNTEGSLDLYRAAQTIYAAQVTAKEFVVNSDEVQIVLQLIPSLFEQERYEEAVAYLNKCLEAEDPE